MNKILIQRKSCKHRNAWIINGGYGLWCYEPKIKSQSPNGVRG
jgi:hypothetical protein